MGVGIGKICLGAGVLIAVAVGAVAAGRASVDTRAARNKGYQAGVQDGYFKGLPVGEAQGRQEGRAIQEGAALPASDRQPVHDAFNDGYVAGADDVFAGYDGGWSLSTPYLIVVSGGTGKIAYRIASRTPLEPHVDYYLCPDGHSICQQPRR
jgi:hypothetical protein